MTKKILVLPGDGIGQEVTASAVEVLDFIVKKFNLQFSISSMEVGGTAYDKFGSPIPNNVLNAAKNEKIKSFVYAASSSTYGDHQDLPKVEDKIGNPLSPYGLTKYVNELYADIFYRVYAFNADLSKWNTDRVTSMQSSE